MPRNFLPLTFGAVLALATSFGCAAIPCPQRNFDPAGRGDPGIDLSPLYRLTAAFSVTAAELALDPDLEFKVPSTRPSPYCAETPCDKLTSEWASAPYDVVALRSISPNEKSPQLFRPEHDELSLMLSDACSPEYEIDWFSCASDLRPDRHTVPAAFYFRKRDSIGEDPIEVILEATDYTGPEARIEVRILSVSRVSRWVLDAPDLEPLRSAPSLASISLRRIPDHPRSDQRPSPASR